MGSGVTTELSVPTVRSRSRRTTKRTTCAISKRSGLWSGRVPARERNDVRSSLAVSVRHR